MHGGPRCAEPQGALLRQTTGLPKEFPMSPILELITPLNVLLAYALTAALWGISLLWRLLKDQPITRQRLVYTGWNVAIMGLAMTIGNAINTAYDRGVISFLTTGIVATIWFAIFAGASFLLERRYPEEPDASTSKG